MRYKREAHNALQNLMPHRTKRINNKRPERKRAQPTTPIKPLNNATTTATKPTCNLPFFTLRFHSSGRTGPTTKLTRRRKRSEERAKL